MFGITLIVSNSMFTVVEPDDGESHVVEICFTAHVTRRITSSYYFEFILLSQTTARVRTDLLPLGLEIPSGFMGTYMRCISLVIIGDDTPGASETVVYLIRPLSIFDQVVLPNNATFDLLRVNIIDNDDDGE